jgi:tetratricopeptide (TPR) repeat protein/transcriptional regulator with XRE-family HTH domain
VTHQAAPDFAGVLRQLRAEALLTQEELAEAAQLSPRTVSDLERGVNRTAHKDTADLLADALGLADPVRALFVAAARGRIPAARVLAARRQVADTAEADPGIDGALAPVTTDASQELLAPAQLPHAMPGFSGRQAEIDWLNSFLPPDGQQGTVVITAIGGTAGIGKTALAVHWAHQIRDRFPDGQLYVNLRGFDPAGQAMEPSDAIRAFLDAFSVPRDRIPVDLEAQAALYRTFVAGRRILIVLDNARDASQVRPLLPGSPLSIVVITSRNQLLSLVAADGARQLRVNLLPAEDARCLLVRRLGHDRVAAEPDAVDAIIGFCAGLPLALSIVSARASASPGLPLAELAVDLRGARGGLYTLDGGDERTDLRAVFSWSYHALSPSAARLFRLLGLHAGPDIGTPAAASLAGLPPAEVRAQLAELASAHLLADRDRRRFTFHDLLRAYARELADAHDSPSERRAAIQRVQDHYLCTAYRADELLGLSRDDDIALLSAGPLVTPENPGDHHQALAWFTAEYQVLLAALRQAAEHGFDLHAWQLAWTLTSFFDRRGHWHDAVTYQQMALDAANRLADPHAQAISHSCLANAYVPLKQFGDAHAHLLQALELYKALGNHAGEAQAHRSLAIVLDRQGRYPEALDHAQQAFELFQAASHPTGQALALNAVGWFHIQLGRHHSGLSHCQRALDLQREIDDQFGQADTLDSIATAYSALGRYQEAIDHYEQAVVLYRDFGHRSSEADTLVSLGDAYLTCGRPTAARDAWHDAVAILDELGRPDAEEIREKLENLATRPRSGNRGRMVSAERFQPPEAALREP